MLCCLDRIACENTCVALALNHITAHTYITIAFTAKMSITSACNYKSRGLAFRSRAEYLSITFDLRSHSYRFRAQFAFAFRRYWLCAHDPLKKYRWQRELIYGYCESERRRAIRRCLSPEQQGVYLQHPQNVVRLCKYKLQSVCLGSLNAGFALSAWRHGSARLSEFFGLRKEKKFIIIAYNEFALLHK